MNHIMMIGFFILVLSGCQIHLTNITLQDPAQPPTHPPRTPTDEIEPPSYEEGRIETHRQELTALQELSDQQAQQLAQLRREKQQLERTIADLRARTAAQSVDPIAIPPVPQFTQEQLQDTDGVISKLIEYIQTLRQLIAAQNIQINP